ncbi:uncharacterized protein LACBIDRAFT_322476 [Laccaria bicolor S238N-H82]|uniref:Predicted protein n=1 Tax=Laccaria bicolor (strain S238N-H82 / ATCC MYA-4686) TaxID=486041 RepID=B0CWF4_LACBS|nr:uncharacterized protein LACBIDRAFT_322476 [Laccaria bicolor S238N-H82]EDR13057.1 predicted protein [Laccaria bicolor S238N-H82]|eukprot:XP_001875555.1 predicted protein [Laccaria bicolor S238N-H82]
MGPFENFKMHAPSPTPLQVDTRRRRKAESQQSPSLITPEPSPSPQPSPSDRSPQLDVITTPVLEQYGVSFNTLYKLLLCRVLHSKGYNFMAEPPWSQLPWRTATPPPIVGLQTFHDAIQCTIEVNGDDICGYITATKMAQLSTVDQTVKIIDISGFDLDAAHGLLHQAMATYMNDLNILPDKDIRTILPVFIETGIDQFLQPFNRKNFRKPFDPDPENKIYGILQHLILKTYKKGIQFMEQKESIPSAIFLLMMNSTLVLVESYQTPTGMIPNHQELWNSGGFLRNGYSGVQYKESSRSPVGISRDREPSGTNNIVANTSHQALYKLHYDGVTTERT